MSCARACRERSGALSGWLLCLCSSATLVSCSDDLSTTATTAGSGGAGGGGPKDVTLRVMEIEPIGEPGAEWPPVEGATVAIDFPDGHREERVTDSAGKVLLEGVDLATGKLRFSAHKPGYWVWSDELPEGQTEWSAPLQTVEPPEMVTISGTAVNMLDENHYLLWRASTSGSLHFGQGPSFSLAVAKGKPFTLIVMEEQKYSASCGRCWNDVIVGWVQVGHRGTTVDLELDVDLADAEPGVVTQGKLEYADGEDSVLLEPGYSGVWTNSFEGRLQHGYVLTSHEAPETTGFTFTAEHYEVEGATDVVTTYMERSLTGSPVSGLLVDGYPRDGMVVSGLLHEPQLVVPADPDPSMPSPMAAGVEWIPVEPTDARVSVYRNQTPLWRQYGTAVWIVNGRDGASRLEFPELPSSADRTELLGTAPLAALLQLMADRPHELRGLYGKVLSLPCFALQP